LLPLFLHALPPASALPEEKVYAVTTVFAETTGACGTAVAPTFFVKADGIEPASGSPVAGHCVGNTAPCGQPSEHGQDEFWCEVVKDGDGIHISAVYRNRCGPPDNTQGRANSGKIDSAGFPTDNAEVKFLDASSNLKITVRKRVRG
jgi:hypothetical protein